MKVKRQKSLASNEIPSLDMAVIHAGLLAEPRNSKVQEARAHVARFLEAGFDFGQNPLRHLRKVLPEWEWSVVGVEPSEDNTYANHEYDARDTDTARTVRVVNWVIWRTSGTFHVTARCVKPATPAAS